MSTLLQELTAAAANAARLAETQTVEAARKAAKYHRVAETKAASGKSTGKGLKQALLLRLPIGEEHAIPLAEVRALVADISYAESGLTATLTWLCDCGDLQRTGVNRRYRYFRTH